MARQNCGYTLHSQFLELVTAVASTCVESWDVVLQLAWAYMDEHCADVAVVAAGAVVAALEGVTITPIPPKLHALAPCD